MWGKRPDTACTVCTVPLQLTYGVYQFRFCMYRLPYAILSVALACSPSGGVPQVTAAASRLLHISMQMHALYPGCRLLGMPNTASTLISRRLKRQCPKLVKQLQRQRPKALRQRQRQPPAARNSKPTVDQAHCSLHCSPIRHQAPFLERTTEENLVWQPKRV